MYFLLWSVIIFMIAARLKLFLLIDFNLSICSQPQIASRKTLKFGSYVYFLFFLQFIFNVFCLPCCFFYFISQIRECRGRRVRHVRELDSNLQSLRDHKDGEALKDLCSNWPLQAPPEWRCFDWSCCVVFISPPKGREMKPNKQAFGEQIRQKTKKK